MWSNLFDLFIFIYILMFLVNCLHIYSSFLIFIFADCMECMACSDNVVRAGLTPKYQDVETLISMLEYKMVPSESRKFQGHSTDEYTVTYNPPVPDFAVDKIEVRIDTMYMYLHNMIVEFLTSCSSKCRLI